MMRKLRAAAIACGLIVYSTSSMAVMHGMGSMSEPDMYNLTIGGLAGGDDTEGIDEKFREMNGVEKIHVDFENGVTIEIARWPVSMSDAKPGEEPGSPVRVRVDFW